MSSDPPKPYLDPVNQAFIDSLANLPPFEFLSVEEFRAAFEQLQAHDPLPGVTRTSFTVPFENGIKTFVFKPTGATGALPVIFYIHGGGWIAGSCVTPPFHIQMYKKGWIDADTLRSVNSFDTICRDLALRTGCAVVFPEYTLAPEARYTTKQEECYAVVKWVRSNGHRKSLSRDAFAVAADTAGAQLSTAVTILPSIRTPPIPLRLHVLLNSLTDT
ncbi:alpha/beta-hydrolase [Patellaria atrata CBS 101060]|uniref:Alpha/beta-hydrolase n=1 Tax=Patellaria atrata CBS 101060 TaxID=1346257 RepID=A0A9P4SEY7_9PEZI|nr:alpha/beta-hydrolase [Patellaria atrata CBS 101060]